MTDITGNKRIHMAALAAAVLTVLLFGGTVWAARRPYVNLPIFMYHDVAAPGEEVGRYAVSAERLRADIALLQARGYTGITVRDLIAYEDQGVPLPDKPVMITFDDGYLSNYTLAYPILRELGFKATICVVGVTAGVTGPGLAHFTWEQAREMQESGLIDIQAHTWDLHHDGKYEDFYGMPYFRGIYRKPGEERDAYRQRLRSDLYMLRDAIEGQAGGDMLLLAYPYGYYDPWVRPVLRELGIRATLLTQGRAYRYSGSLFNMTRREVRQESDLGAMLAGL